MEYKFVNKYLDKNKKKSGLFNKFLIKLCVYILLLLSTLVFLKYDKNNKQIIYKYLEDKNINMASINKWYKNKFGDITPFQNLVKDKTKLVFNDSIIYNNVSKYKNGCALSVSDSYLVPVLESGIVVFIGEKDDFGKTVIIKQTNGIDVWYGNISNVNLSLYDYTSKGELLGEASKTLYLAFLKNGEFLNYENYIK